MSDLKLFVWEYDSDGGYSDSLVCVLAHDVEEARGLIQTKFALPYETHDWAFRTRTAGEPRVVTEPEAFGLSETG